jgi:hypothetical protein
MKKLKNLLIGIAFILAFAAPVTVVALPQSAHARSISSVADCESPFLGMPPWFRGLVKVDGGQCVVISPNSPDPENSSKTIDVAGFIWRVALNVIEIGLFLAGYAALGFILFGGFMFLTGGANPGQTEKARVTLLNAIIGFAISTAAIGAVNLIFNVIK